MTMTSGARRICAIAAMLSCPAAAVAEAPAGWSEPTVAHSGIRVMSADGETGQSRFHWVTEHWIPVKSEVWMRDDHSFRIEMEIHELNIGAQDPALFELPAGASRMPGFGGH